ncbi:MULTISPECIES: 6-phospho-beta-glucosidase [Citrobacter]|uniref:6-phospho-beta-glucosidase n=1 Tax=Citrobacter braakii TaxID=57706 RepID=A0A8I0G619_CITBR|nr:MULTISPECIES: 6-phospho-beta-glucosidase [Citrobacter]MBD3124004.1 6-phospho-beta-glucosidase [Citrobacter braakii]MDM3385703.1 6-phospho-beta-glucosidase [Citrobacter sp. Cb011]MDM3422853.1 6-phospho-beta-glucosidase [Citrobacter sp. Cb025]MDM3442919.1 6-phospho-beta-glucosidase [Citrobacter sp. Cb063]MEB7707227.1 6-phospho-beta-glucosidase [Citrobacter braakii]
MKKLKLVVIGAGSSYTPELIEGVIKNYHQLPISHIAFVDVEMGKEKMNIIFDLTKRMLAKANLPIDVIQTFDRKTALLGADFVVTQLRVGGIDARIVDEKLPKSYGFIGQETNGAGGMFKALRTIPVIIEIANEMKAICPNAWLINFTNPASMVTEAVLKYSHNNRVIGLCNGPVNMTHQVAGLLNANVEDLYVEFKGSNHMNFITKILHNGVDRTRETIEIINAADVDALSFKNISNEQFNKELLAAANLIPSSYLKYYLKTTEMLAEQEAAEQSRGEIVKNIEAELFKKYSDVTLQDKPKELEARGGALYSTAALNVIRAIYLDDKSIQTVNVRNGGAITNLPEEAVVEVNCVLTRNGPIPICTGEIPSPAKGIVSMMKDYESQIVKAAATGDYQALISGFIFNPLCSSDTSGVALVKEMLLANKKYLPLFAKKIESL